MEPMQPMKPMKPMEPMKPMTFDQPAKWWPDALGDPNTSGSQNDVHYAYFATAKRLLLKQGDTVTTYDTGEHRIQGVSQASDVEHARFTSNLGSVDLAQLKRI